MCSTNCPAEWFLPSFHDACSGVSPAVASFSDTNQFFSLCVSRNSCNKIFFRFEFLLGCCAAAKTLDRNNAANWAQEFRNNIYRYTHAYRVVTGVDLTMDKAQTTSTFAIQPAYLIQQRLVQERGAGTFVQNQRLMARTKDRRV